MSYLKTELSGGLELFCLLFLITTVHIQDDQSEYFGFTFVQF